MNDLQDICVRIITAYFKSTGKLKKHTGTDPFFQPGNHSFFYNFINSHRDIIEFSHIEEIVDIDFTGAVTYSISENKSRGYMQFIPAISFNCKIFFINR